MGQGNTKLTEQAVLISTVTSASEVHLCGAPILTAEIKGFKKLTEKLMGKAVSASQEMAYKKLGELCLAIPWAMVGIAITADQCLLSWPSGGVSKLCSAGEPPTRSLHRRAEESQSHE